MALKTLFARLRARSCGVGGALGWQGQRLTLARGRPWSWVSATKSGARGPSFGAQAPARLPNADTVGVGETVFHALRLEA